MGGVAGEARISIASSLWKLMLPETLFKKRFGVR